MLEGNIRIKLCRKMLYASYSFKHRGIRTYESLNRTDNVNDI